MASGYSVMLLFCMLAVLPFIHAAAVATNTTISDEATQGVSIEFSRDNHHLNIHCGTRMSNSSTTVDVSFLEMWKTFEGEDDQQILMASSPPRTNTTDKLHGATLTSGISSQPFINLHWTSPSPDLDGLYTCAMSAVDAKTNVSLKVKDTKYLKTVSICSPSLATQMKTTNDVTVMATSSQIMKVLTRKLSINCTLPVNNTSFKDVSSIIVSKAEDSNLGNESSWNELASLIQNSEGEVKQRNSSVGAVSSGDILYVQDAYLALEWLYPSVDVAGRFR